MIFKKKAKKSKVADKKQQNLISLKPSQHAISVRNLFFTYSKNKENVLNNISFDIPHNSYVCIIGHNGSGKSTLSKLIIGLLFPQSGKTEIDGIEITHKSLPTIRKRIGIVFQNPDNQFIGSTVRDDIVFGLENYQVDPSKMSAIVEDVARKTGILDLLDEEPSNLSGGQKQRVAIASTIALNSNILILDEITSMLDATGKEYIKEIMLELKTKTKKTIISITHDMSEIINADLIMVLDHGSLILQGPPSIIIEKQDLLKKISLDIPNVLQFSQDLNKSGLPIKPTLNYSQLISEITTMLKK